MYLIVGLGNPGNKYVNTPHNAGFQFADSIHEFLGWDSLYSVGDWLEDKNVGIKMANAKTDGRVRIILAKPQLFMNRSGLAVKKVIKELDIDIKKQLIVAHDDLDIKLGEYKIQRGKGPKGHNGLISIEEHLGSNDFLRVRIGVESRESVHQMPGEQFVLEPMSDLEQITLKEGMMDCIKDLRATLLI